MRTLNQVGKKLPFQKPLQIGKKAGVGNGYTFRVADNRFSLRPECSDSESHGDAMIAERLDFRAMQPLTTGNAPSIVGLLDLRTHRPQVLGDCAQTIRLLDA